MAVVEHFGNGLPGLHEHNTVKGEQEIMPRLYDHASKQAEGLPLRLDNIEGQEVTIESVRWNTGNFGPYAVMTLEMPNGEEADVMTSAMLVIDALQNAEDADAFPCQATFKRNGRTWIIE